MIGRCYAVYAANVALALRWYAVLCYAGKHVCSCCEVSAFDGVCSQMMEVVALRKLTWRAIFAEPSQSVSSAMHWLYAAPSEMTATSCDCWLAWSELGMSSGTGTEALGCCRRV